MKTYVLRESVLGALSPYASLVLVNTERKVLIVLI